MVRELAEYRVEDFAAVTHWPIREALIAYRSRMMHNAREDYRHELAVWATIAVHSTKKETPPLPPAILREVVIDA